MWRVAMLLAAGCGRVGFAETESVATQAITVPAFSTSSSTFTPIPGGTISIPPGIGLRWLLLTSATLRSSASASTDTAVEIQYTVNGEVRGIGGTQTGASDRPGPWQHMYAFHGEAYGQSIAFELRDAAAATSTVEQLHAIAIPLPDTSDLQIANVDQIDVSGSALAPYAELSIDPARPGEYVMIAVANTTELPDHSGVYLQIRDTTGTIQLSAAHNPREALQSYFMMWTETLSSRGTCTFESRTGNVLGSSQIRFARVAAFRADSLQSVEISESRSSLIATAATPTIFHSAVTSPTGSEFVHIASVVLTENCPAPLTGGADRSVRFMVDGQLVSTINHVSDNCGFDGTYGVVEQREAAPSEVSIEVASGNGTAVTASNARIMILGLP